MNIGDEIKKMRNSARLTQKGLAERIGGNRQTIANLENKQYDNPSMRLVLRISDACGFAVELNFVPINTECKELTL